MFYLGALEKFYNNPSIPVKQKNILIIIKMWEYYQ